MTTDEITPKIIIAQENDGYIKTLKNDIQGQINNYDLNDYILYKLVSDQKLLVVLKT